MQILVNVLDQVEFLYFSTSLQKHEWGEKLSFLGFERSTVYGTNQAS